MRNLEQAMKRFGVTVYDLQETMNCSEKTVRNKMNGIDVYKRQGDRGFSAAYDYDLSGRLRAPGGVGRHGGSCLAGCPHGAGQLPHHLDGNLAVVYHLLSPGRLAPPPHCRQRFPAGGAPPEKEKSRLNLSKPPEDSPSFRRFSN